MGSELGRQDAPAKEGVTWLIEDELFVDSCAVLEVLFGDGAALTGPLRKKLEQCWSLSLQVAWIIFLCLTPSSCREFLNLSRRQHEHHGSTEIHWKPKSCPWICAKNRGSHGSCVHFGGAWQANSMTLRVPNHPASESGGPDLVGTFAARRNVFLFLPVLSSHQKSLFVLRDAAYPS